MQLLENRIPPVLVVLLLGGAMRALALYIPAVAISDAVRISSAAGIFLVGALICLAGVLSLTRAKTTTNPMKPETASELVKSGIYQHTRNPMYLGLALSLVAWTAYLASPWTLFGVIGFVAYMNRFQIAPE